MEKLDIDFLQNCIKALEKAFELYNTSDKKSVESNIYRSACIKEFEIIVEQSTIVIKKILVHDKNIFH